MSEQQYIEAQVNNREVIAYNRRRWNALSKAGVSFSQPWIDLTAEEAHRRVDPRGILGSVAGKSVLCLAASGGQQSAAFCLLGARVTVYDLSDTQLQKDVETAGELGFEIETIQGDMQEVDVLGIDSFDVVWMAHGINFVPSARKTIRGAARVLKPEGIFRIECTNPYVHGIWDRWNGKGYEVTEPFSDGGEVCQVDDVWEVAQPDGTVRRIQGPKEFRHPLSTIINTLVNEELTILGLWESKIGDRLSPGGTWDHFRSRIPPWIEIWARG
jgi:SAM-dependent methyltransferase